MKHWIKGPTESGYGPTGLLLTDGETERTLSIKKEKGNVIFREENSGYFFIELSKEEAIKALQEAIDYINSDQD